MSLQLPYDREHDGYYNRRFNAVNEIDNIGVTRMQCKIT